MKIKVFLLLISLCFFSTSMSGRSHHGDCVVEMQQPGDQRPKFNPEQFRRDLIAFISEKAGMTDEEARSFFPLFFEMREKMRNIEHQKGRVIHKVAENKLTERDCQRVLDEIIALDKKSTSVETQYLNRLKKIVGANRLLKVLNADREFGRRTFRNMTR